MDAHLVFDTGTAHGIAGTVGQQLGHKKQRNASASWRRIRQAGQGQVNDVACQVMRSAGYEDLLPADTVAAVIRRYGSGPRQTKIAPAWGSVRHIVASHSPLTI